MRHPKAVADEQRVFLEKIDRYEQDGRAIVYIDESGFAHDMPRTHGYFLRLIRLFRGGWHDQRRQHVDQGAPLGIGWKRGEAAHAIGRSRGGRTSKFHALTDEIGRPVALCLTPGQAHDLSGVAELLTRIPTPRRLLADRAYSQMTQN